MINQYPLTDMTRELIAQAEQPASEWQHLKPYGYAPGDYMNKCLRCGAHVGAVDKRAISCRPCAEKAFAQAEQSAEPVAWHHPTLGFMLNSTVKANGRRLGPSWTPLYARPDPRVAELEGLLREALKTLLDWRLSVGLRERIEAALGEG